ncbi:MAG: AraC family transcriptional regulator, partial [Bacteroidia bacterium]|nr:AraC family transcriptional regulator [Bacteroidia bacterium]
GYAKELIRSKKTSTNEEIAIASGFSSARNFTRQFRIIEGTTPSRYRKAIEIGIR